MRGGGIYRSNSARAAQVAAGRTRLGRVFLCLCMMAAVAATVLFSVPQTVWAAVSDHTVQGVSPRGTTINVFDYTVVDPVGKDNWNWSALTSAERNSGINNDHVLKLLLPI